MKQVRLLIIIGFWLAVWQIASLLIDKSIVMVGPVDVICSFAVLLPEPEFWRAIGNSIGKISLGFLFAFVTGVFLGVFAYAWNILREFLAPVVMLMKSVPVASFIILALIWIGSKNLAVFASYVVVFPMVYGSTIAGLQSTDKKLLEMAQVFSIPLGKRIRYIYLPALLPYLSSSCEAALGMAWKSGIAAEVIGVPAHTIGEHLYLSKVFLNTADLFAWTIVIILVSALFEKVFLLVLRCISPGG